MNEERFRYLFNRHFQRSSSLEERIELFGYAAGSQYDTILKSMIDETWNNNIPEYHQSEETINQIYKMILQSKEVETVVVSFNKNRWARIAAAAVIFVLLGVGIASIVGVFNKKQEQVATIQHQDKRFKNDVAAPQTNKAILTLSDGTTIVLDSAGNGSLAVQGNVNVVKTADGQIVYNGDVTEIKYNTLTVSKGSKPVQLQLADGSNVWLNVASSITYPTAFINKERKVQITGEAYFEVAHNAAMPFVVQKNEISVQVLGTHFNVNTYDDENEIKITLLEGSVKVSKGNKTNLIKPGQQAQVASEIKVITADVDEVMAWKNGLFSFNKVDLQTVLRQLTKWYDVEVVFQGNIPKQTFGGDMERTLSLAQVLKILEKSEVHFKIDGKKIIVMP